MANIGTVDLINLIASISAIILALLAIALSIVFYFAAKSSQRDTETSVIEIREATKTLSNISMRMLNKLTTAITEAPRATEERLWALLEVRTTTGLASSGEDSSSGTFSKAQLEQFRVDNLITALHYCALSNIALQDSLPPTLAASVVNPAVANLVDTTKRDYDTMLSWLGNTPDIETKITSSPVKHLYDAAISWGEAVRSSAAYYAGLPAPMEDDSTSS